MNFIGKRILTRKNTRKFNGLYVPLSIFRTILTMEKVWLLHLKGNQPTVYCCNAKLEFVTRRYSNKSFFLSICTWFLKNQVWKIKFDELDFLTSLNWIFTASVACKIQVWNRPKIQFIKLDFSNSIFQKSSADKQGVLQVY